MDTKDIKYLIKSDYFFLPRFIRDQNGPLECALFCSQQTKNLSYIYITRKFKKKKNTHYFLMSFKILSSSISSGGNVSVNIYNLFEGIIYYDQSKMPNESGITKKSNQYINKSRLQKENLPLSLS